jgi:two-component system, NarL family, sensor kinase
MITDVNDNGKGFDITQQKKGLGLGNLELRMQYLNALHKIKSAPAKGTVATVCAAL